MLPVDITVNGEMRRAFVDARTTLADFLREDCGLTGTHLGCEHGVCGACIQLGRGQHCDHAVEGARGRHIQQVDATPRDVAANERAMEHARQHHVVDIAAVAGEQARVFAARHRLPDEPAGGRVTHRHDCAARCTARTMP